MKLLCRKETVWTGLLLAMLSLNACGNSDNYPSEYIGFDKLTDSYTIDKERTEQDINLKIIAASKSNQEREVTLTGRWRPGTQPVFKLLDTKVVIPAKKKSATARIRVYPKLLNKKQEIRIICSPKDKEIKQTQVTLKLVPQ